MILLKSSIAFAFMSIFTSAQGNGVPRALYNHVLNIKNFLPLKVETSNFCSNIPENIGGVWNGKERIKECSTEEEILIYVNEWPAFNLFLKIACDCGKQEAVGEG